MGKSGPLENHVRIADARAIVPKVISIGLKEHVYAESESIGWGCNSHAAAERDLDEKAGGGVEIRILDNHGVIAPANARRHLESARSVIPSP